jgi:hypothetical protein
VLLLDRRVPGGRERLPSRAIDHSKDGGRRASSAASPHPPATTVTPVSGRYPIRVCRVAVGAMLVAACARDREAAAIAEDLVPLAVATSPPDVPLTDVHDLLVDAEGRVHVLDATPFVRVLRPDGTLLRTLGREGSGPGEFRRILSAALAADTLFVFDPDLGRVTALAGREGAAVSMAAVRDAYPFHIHQLQRLPDGRFVVALRRAYGDRTGRREGRDEMEIVRLHGADGALLRDSILLLREHQHLEVQDPAGAAVLRDPFGRRTLLRTSARGDIHVAWSDSAVFHVHAADGALLRSVRARAPVPRRPITRAERDSIVASYALAPERVPAVRRALARRGHESWPLLLDFLVDDRERIWFAPQPAPGASTVTWTAIDADGVSRVRLTLPVGTRLHAVHGDRAYTSERDSLDVPRVVVHALAPAGRIS